MTANQAVFPVQIMAQVMGVSRSGFYAWCRRAPSDRDVADTVLTGRIAKIHSASKESYGAPRIHAELAPSRDIASQYPDGRRMMASASVASGSKG